jgi:adenylate cyclase
MLVFGVLNATFSALLALAVAVTVGLGGVTTSAFSYVLTERLARTVAARALRSGLPAGPSMPGVTARAVAAWALGSGVAAVGVALVGLAVLLGAETSTNQLAITMLVLGGVVLVFGLLLVLLYARAAAAPVDSVRSALARVEEGDLDTELPVYDGSELGLLQAGFNQMAAGLRERERMRELFGRHVGEDVVREAMEHGVELGGERRTVGVLFVDLIGSTELAATCPPEEVVALLNEFFELVVAVVDEHGGWINKFEGDGALAVFGAPVDRPDAPACALAAARTLGHRLTGELPRARAAIGASAGEVVAGHIGGENRHEYTVIGDPVNEAARLTELAKTLPGRVVASEAALTAAGDGESSRWDVGDEVQLRGRPEPTRIAEPVQR